MKRFASIIVIIAMFAILFAVGTVNAAPDRIIDSKVQTATVAKDKNGAEYVRLIVEDKRSLNGLEYVASVPAMCFGTTVDQAKPIRAGQTAKLVVSESEYQGKKSYTVLHIVEVK
jgi:hypothetical protein